jgi:hypothetical protein
VLCSRVLVMCTLGESGAVGLAPHNQRSGRDCGAIVALSQSMCPGTASFGRTPTSKGALHHSPRRWADPFGSFWFYLFLPCETSVAGIARMTWIGGAQVLVPSRHGFHNRQ